MKSRDVSVCRIADNLIGDSTGHKLQSDDIAKYRRRVGGKCRYDQHHIVERHTDTITEQDDIPTMKGRRDSGGELGWKRWGEGERVTKFIASTTARWCGTLWGNRHRRTTLRRGPDVTIGRVDKV